MKASPKPTISVILAVHNGMPYLKDAIKSILTQTYRDFEFIVIDDASSDESYKYLKNLKDKRIVLIKNLRNLGLAASLNKGLEKSRGAFIARMDADDVSLPERFEKQIKFLNAHPKIAICGTWAKLIDDKGKTPSLVTKPIDDARIKKENFWIPALIHPTWMVRKEVFEKIGRYDPKYDMIEDLEFLNRAKSFKMANIGEPLLLWRSIQNRRSKKDIQKMYKKTLDFRFEQFKNGNFGLSFLPRLLRSIITTYLIPTKLKIYINERAGSL